ncbi:MAG: 3-hydroxyacyl-CoA dehydrogenase [Olegusella sp.]|nr:3-hydroxyacyl-CoA dehydrogenase [Olegusella sp.]
MDVKDIKKVVVAGGGVLGSQIAFQSAYMGYDVTIWLRSEGSIGRCQPKIDRLHKIYLDTLEAMKTDPRAYAYGLVAKEECTPEKCEALKANVEAAYKNLKLVTDWDEAFGDADYVIEAVAEDPKQKEDFYTELQKHLPEKTFIVTNSSTLLPSTFAEYTGRPEKFLALHFANDIWKMPTAEVMRHAGTGDEAFELTVAFAASIRMVPLKVQKEVPGYLLNSMLVPFLSAAEALWAGGVGSVEDIDRAWTLSTGAPAGPFRILDIVGLTTAYNIAIMDPRAKDPTTIQSVIAAKLKEKIDRGETGINAGKGYYDYTK